MHDSSSPPHDGNIVATPRLFGSAFESCPPEIMTKIFSSACMDNGATGRSLSLVSKYIHDTSEPIKLRSVAVHGLSQMQSFATLLENVPSNMRRVKHLFVSIDNGAPAPRMHAGLHYCDRSTAHTRAGAAATTGALWRILQSISTSIESFTMINPQSESQSLLSLGVSLPFLTELTLIGTCPKSFPLLPQLRRLDVAGRNTSSKLLSQIAAETPSVTHLRLSGMYLMEASFIAATATEDPNVVRFVEDLDLFLLELTPSVEQLYTYGTSAASQWDSASRLLERSTTNVDSIHSKLRLLASKSKKLAAYEVPIAQELWLGRINGGDGCWKFDASDVYAPACYLRALAFPRLVVSGFDSNKY